jgi:hypothetical protein
MKISFISIIPSQFSGIVEKIRIGIFGAKILRTAGKQNPCCDGRGHCQKDNKWQHDFAASLKVWHGSSSLLITDTASRFRM